MSERLVDACPHCGGKTGIARKEWVPHTRFANWGEEDSESELSLEEVKAGRWTCQDCGHGFNVLPMAGPS